jgi:hypothetical protein
MGAEGLAVATSGIPLLLVGWQGMTRRRPHMILVIGTDDGRTRVLNSSDSETLEQLAHQLRQKLAREQVGQAKKESALAALQSA